ncbi:extracellular solute-binding protein [Eubacteriales bacterium OttesenSCG-928-A19]|nr:extracellular solute-binding protein [Eubacteriales bacterium OttesenSCG-928-A19]
MKKTRLALALALLLALPSSVGLAADALPTSDIVTPAGELPIVTEPITLTFGVATQARVEDFDTNLYTLFLEEQTGVDIAFDMLPTKDAVQKVQLAMMSGGDMPDAYLQLDRSAANPFSVDNAPKYGREGIIYPLNDMIDEYGYYLNQVFEEQPELRALITSADGNIYFFPGYSPSTINKSPTKFWINQGWLDNLGLEVPTTTEEFYEVLLAFKNDDPNGNGKQDEIPMAGTLFNNGFWNSGYDYLINAFIYNDPQNTRLYVEDGVVDFAPVKEGWRDAMIYLNRLCAEDLLSPLTFTQDEEQLKQMCNDTNDILGGYTALGIQHIANGSSEEVISRYAAIPPLEGPTGLRVHTMNPTLPYTGGVITTACEDPVAMFRLFDYMMSEEACLRSRYGEKGVDWDDPAPGDISIFGTEATVKILSPSMGTTQNATWINLQPYISRPKHSNGQGWNGNPLEGEYINAQAAMMYQEYAPTEFVSTLIMNEEEVERVSGIRLDIETYIKENIAQFATGVKDPNDDAVWDAYVAEYEKLDLPTFLEVARTVYARMNDN